MRQKILIDGISIALMRAVGMGLGLLVTIVLGRTLGPTDFGMYGYTIILLSLLAVPVSNGWATLTLRSVSAAVHNHQWHPVKGMIQRGAQLSLSLSIFAFALTLLVYCFFIEPTSKFLSVTIIGLLAFVLWFDQISALRLAVLRGLQHPVWGQAPEMLARPLLIVLFFLLVAHLVGPSLRAQHAIWALLAASGMTTLLGGWVLWRKMPRELATAPAGFDNRTWLASAGLLAGNAGLVMLNSQVDILMLGMLGSFADVGAYRVAAQIATLSGFAYTALNMLAMQRFAYLRTAGDLKQLQETATLMARLSLLGTLPLPIIFYFFGEPILGKVFGEQFLAAIKPLFWLFGAQSISASLGMASTLLVVHRHEASIIPFTVVALLLNIVLCFFLIPKLGIVGAGISALISQGAWNIALWVSSIRKLDIDSSFF